MAKSLIGKGPSVINMVVDEGSFQPDLVGDMQLNHEYGPACLVGTGLLNGKKATLITNNAQVVNPRFPVVYLGIIGMEEAYKMAMAVYYTLEADKQLPLEEKRPIVLLVDTPGNAPGKIEEILGMNKATGAYQLALAEARKAGHPVIAVVIGRAISGGFLCHGLQADRILAMGDDYTTMVHVMPISSISRITKLDVERLEALSKDNPVFAAGAKFFHRLGGVDSKIEDETGIRDAVIQQAEEITQLKAKGAYDKVGPQSRGNLGAERGGRTARKEVLDRMDEEFAEISESYLK